jgi:hypothetical protein
VAERIRRLDTRRIDGDAGAAGKWLAQSSQRWAEIPGRGAVTVE